MAISFPARLTSITAEANRIAPKRRKSSDGMLGDAAHRAEVSDHNPDARGVVHAVDVSQSMPGLPYWESGMDEFDVWQYAYDIAHAYISASPAVRVQRWPWLATGGYMVWFDGTKDIIFDPSVSLTIRQNGSFKTAHGDAPHTHFSIGHNAQSENDTQPIFAATAAPPDPEDLDMTEDELVKILRRELAAFLGGASTVPKTDTVVDVVKHYATAILAKLPK